MQICWRKTKWFLINRDYITWQYNVILILVRDTTQHFIFVALDRNFNVISSILSTLLFYPLSIRSTRCSTYVLDHASKLMRKIDKNIIWRATVCTSCDNLSSIGTGLFNFIKHTWRYSSVAGIEWTRIAQDRDAELSFR